MKHLMAYSESQNITLNGERAFAELYMRLARWTGEIAHAYCASEAHSGEQRLDRCIALVGYMDRVIDLSNDYRIGVAVLSLHHFAIATMVKAKAERDGKALEPLPQLFLTLAEIFATIHERRGA